jgi:hypothetical protein
VSRTVVFAFCLGNRQLGMLSACVAGKCTAECEFTSSLAVLKLLASAIDRRFA